MGPGRMCRFMGYIWEVCSDDEEDQNAFTPVARYVEDVEMSKDGGPAFPLGDQPHGGMSLRDWFAGQALVGIYAREGPGVNLKKDAAWFYEIADAMLAARQKEGAE